MVWEFYPEIIILTPQYKGIILKSGYFKGLYLWIYPMIFGGEPIGFPGGQTCSSSYKTYCVRSGTYGRLSQPR